MKIVLLITTSFLALSLNSQVSIDHNDFYSSGESVGISTTTDLTIDYTTSGPNTIWDFSQLKESSQLFETAHDISTAGLIIKFQFGSAAPSAYRTNYFQSFDGLPIKELTNFLPIEISSVNRMVKIDNSKLTFPGYSLEVSGQLVGFKSSIIETAYEFPLNYGDNYSSDGYTDINFAPIYDARIIMKRHRESNVDGYGKLIMPDETYDVLRIQHVITELDSINIPLGPTNQWIPINRINSEYEWWAKGMKRPVLKVETETFMGVESPTRITYINGQVSSTKENNSITNLYPNPSNGILNIESIEIIESIKIFGTDGKKVFEQANSEKTKTLNLSHLSPGMYTIQAISKNGQTFNSIVIK